MLDDDFGAVELVFSFGVVIAQERFPITWNHVIDKESLKIRMLGRFSSKSLSTFSEPALGVWQLWSLEKARKRLRDEESKSDERG